MNAAAMPSGRNQNSTPAYRPKRRPSIVELQRPTLDRTALEQRLDRLEVQVDALEEQQREEQPRLTRGDPAGEPALLGRVGLAERDGVARDVRVLADLVRVAVVLGVLVHPPAVAEAGEADGQDPAGAVVGLARGEDLAVRGLVAEEGELRQHEAERAGHEQLQPRLAEQHDAGGDAAEGQQQQAEDQGVEAARPGQQARRYAPRAVRAVKLRVSGWLPGEPWRCGGPAGRWGRTKARRLAPGFGLAEASQPGCKQDQRSRTTDRCSPDTKSSTQDQLGRAEPDPDPPL